MSAWTYLSINFVIPTVVGIFADLISQRIEIHCLGHLASDPMTSDTKAINDSKGEQQQQQQQQNQDNDNGTENTLSANKPSSKFCAGLQNFMGFDLYRTYLWTVGCLPLTFVGIPWYNIILPAMVPGHSFRDAFLMTVIDCTLGMYTVPLLIGGMTVVQGQGFHHFVQKMKQDALPMSMWGIIIYFPLELFEFYLIPYQYRVYFDNITELFIWVGFAYLASRAVPVEELKEDSSSKSKDESDGKGEGAETANEVAVVDKAAEPAETKVIS